MRSAYLSHPSFVRHEMGPGHPECPERIGAVADRLLSRGLLDVMESFEAPAATREQILRVHAAAHFDSLLQLAPERGYAQVDPDTVMNPHTWTASLHAAGAAVLAAELVGEQGYKRAFCNVRPPGHHAERHRAMGFCFFDNVAVGMAHALEVLGYERVLLADFDVHHGNGSEQIFADDPRVLMVSTFQSPLYPYSGEPPLGTNMVNVALRPYSRGDALKEGVQQRWLPAIEAFEPQIVFISAGFDAHRDDDISHLMWEDADYGWVTQQLVEVANRHAQGRVVSMLEGGYNLPALGRSAEQHVRALLELG